MFGELLLISSFSLILYAFYKWATVNNDYFERRNIKYMKPKFLVGNTGGAYMKKYTGAEYANRLYHAFPNERIYGIFDMRSPQYIIRDPNLYKHIAVKASEHFEERLTIVDETSDKLWGNALLQLRGEKWRNMRTTLSSAFSGSKMKQMFDLVAECAVDVVKHFQDESETTNNKLNIEMRDTFTRYTHDLIAKCAFGVNYDSFAEPTNEFYRNSKILMESTPFNSAIKLFIISKFSPIARALNISFSPVAIANSFKSTILDVMEMRKKNDIHCPDILNSLMKIRDDSLKTGKTIRKLHWSDDEIIGQCFTFLLAEFDTLSTALTFTAYEIVANPDVQKKLYEEIVETNEQLEGKRVTYDAIQNMKYLDQVIYEALRKWPTDFLTSRVCTKDYNYDDGDGDGDGLKLNIRKGEIFWFPIFSVQNDPKYFPEPNRFDPERFSDENKSRIVSGTHLPFGSGPRYCIGSRLALIQVKTIFYYLLLNFSFEPNEKSQIPIKLMKSAFSLEPEDGFYMELKPRQK